MSDKNRFPFKARALGSSPMRLTTKNYTSLFPVFIFFLPRLSTVLGEPLSLSLRFHGRVAGCRASEVRR